MPAAPAVSAAPAGQVLEFTGVTKRFGPIAAVDGLTARVEPGRVTGFLGPNGAGKTTSLRILLGLVSPTSGRATIGGKRYAELSHPLQTVGAALEASSFHPGRSAANHLKVYAQAAGLPAARIDEVLGLVGLADAAGRKVGGFSLGMRQRLSLAYTLLGGPGVLVLDEPANGLDPEGIKWLRGFLGQLAREGRTVLVSSHMLAEVQQTVDALLIISRGRLVYEGDIDGLTVAEDYTTVIDAPDRAALARALDAAGMSYDTKRAGLAVPGAEPAVLGAVAAAAGVALSQLQRRGPALEEVFLELVNGTRVAGETVHEARTARSGPPEEPTALPEQETADRRGEEVPR
ncbi:ATP-binding cassette domain-containing protein [Microbacterium sp.]|uniref:ATP-binding cassette domain-containing protein n=1 Tax=Microbacterium sp. TaxID=51671 RepID=UPI003C74220C